MAVTARMQLLGSAVDFRRRLRGWFRRSARELPWRGTRDPYAIWVSEVMLQQTQVATVREYYRRFLAAFPTVGRLAAADGDDVLRLWEGLGYYRRARQLHQAAQQVVAEHGGRIPREIDVLRSLPGIGRYTAGAILSFAFDQAQPIVEANTLRLYSRLLGYTGDPTATAGQRVLWQFAADILPGRGLPGRILPGRGAGELNQALMELGSVVCTPRSPDCPACPVQQHCQAFARRLTHKIPAAKRPPVMENVREAAAVALRRGKVLLVRRQPGQRWAGLWDFIRVTLTDGIAPEAALADALRADFGLTADQWRPLATLKHGVTRFRITLTGHQCRVTGKLLSTAPEYRWTPLAQLADIPLHVTARRLARIVAGDKA